MTDKKIKNIEDRLENINLNLKSEAEFNNNEINRIFNKLERIASTLLRSSNNKDEWKGTGFFRDAIDDYK